MTPVEWRHNINLPDVGVTGGFYDPADDLERCGVPKTLSGERLLDVGCSDGGHAFLCEERGASVLGIDDESSPRNEGRNNFEFSQKRLESSVEYRTGSVHDLVAGGEPKFDRVLHFNVLYHVQDLLGEGRALRDLIRPGGTLHLKTKFLSYVPSRTTSFVPRHLWERLPQTIKFIETDLAGDTTCYFVPSISAVGALLRRSGFDDVTVTAVHMDRVYLAAR